MSTTAEVERALLHLAVPTAVPAGGRSVPVSKRLSASVSLVGALMLLLLPVSLDAQRRRDPGTSTSRAVPRSSGQAGRPAGPRGGRRVTGWYGPRYGYGPYWRGYYGHPWGYYPYWGQLPYYGLYEERGSLRIDVEPEETEVYVDGYYAGTVDSYDGFFQRLHLPPGEHDIELRLEGYQSLQEQLYLPIGSTYRITHQMEPLAPGETTPPPPEPPEPPDGFGAPAEPFQSPPPGRAGRRMPPPASATSDLGILVIRVQPEDALILVDGEEWQTPRGTRLELDLTAGPHQVEIQREGYEGYVTTVQLTGGEVTNVNISLPRLEGTR